jgi:large subunit ribosomal protein L18
MATRVINLPGRETRKARVRKKIMGSKKRPRLNVYRSNKHIYAQLVEDMDGGTIVSVSTLSKEFRQDVSKMKKVDAAKKVGELIGKLAKEKNIEKVVFDRSGYLYHGRVKALAEGAREAGLKF